MEHALQTADSFLSKLNPTMLERLIEIIDKWHPHGA
jgi:hypothetical protein